MSSSQPPSHEEFYVNYLPIPAGYRRFLLRFIPLLVLGAILFAVIFPGLHNQFNSGKVYGKTDIEGLLVENPLPHLVVPRPGNVESQTAFSRYLLTGPGKTAPKAKVLDHVGQWVKLNGTLVSRKQLSVVAARSAEPINPPTGVTVTPKGTSLGDFTLTGEILDSKCYPGVMKPGQSKTHRACAIRCISGGVPPVFRVQNSREDTMYFLLADGQGQAVDKDILDFVADPVQITGKVLQYDDMFVLQADPSTYERV